MWCRRAVSCHSQMSHPPARAPAAPVAPALAVPASASARVLFADGASTESDMRSFESMCTLDEADYLRRFALHTPLILSGRRTSGTGTYSQRLECLKPSGGSWLTRNEPLKQPLIHGRVCAHDLCSKDNCALHIRDEVLLPSEAARLVAHGESVLNAEDAGANYAFDASPYKRSRRVDFLQSATHGTRAGHLLSLRVVERLRRIAATTFGLPLSQVWPAEHFVYL